MDFIDLKTQYRALKASIDARMAAVLEHGQYIMGPEVAELEARLSAYVGVEHAIAVASGTDALLIAMMALDIAPGDEVITSPFSFIAVAEMIALLGARPVFVDIDPGSYNLDPALIENAITAKTRAIVPVNLYGQCADYDRIAAIARKQGIAVIEDAAQSFGATYKGRRSCSLATIACTSFFPSKPLGCYGDGGACFTADRELAGRMREIRLHGQSGRYQHARLGVNGRLDTLQAAVLLAKLDRFEDEVAARQRNAERYRELLGGAGDSITLPAIEPHNMSVYAQYTIGVHGRDAVAQRLAAAGIPTAIHYPEPLHLQPVFAQLGYAAGGFPCAEMQATRVLSLPMHAWLEASQQERICSATLVAVREAG